jgi:uncharacterized protein YjiS (DUF1127 family)
MLRRETSRMRTARGLRQLDDRLLEDIGIPRARIDEATRRASVETVPVPAIPIAGIRAIGARLKRWRRRRSAILELVALDSRLLRDIGIESDQVESTVDTLLDASERRRKDRSAMFARKAPRMAAAPFALKRPGGGMTRQVLGADRPAGSKHELNWRLRRRAQ